MVGAIRLLARSGFGALVLLSRLALAQGSAVVETFQEGLYLQHTRGQVPEALSSYERAIGLNPLTPPTAVLLQRAQCLRLLRRGGDAKASIRAVATRFGSGDRLGAVRDLPAGLGVVAYADLDRLGITPVLGKLTFSLDGKPLDISTRIAALGVDPRTAVQRVSLGVALGDGDAHLLDGVVLHIEGELANLRVGPAADALADILRLEQLSCEVTVDSGAHLECRLDGTPSPRNVRRRSIRVAGRGVEVVQVEKAGEPAVELWLSAVGERTLSIGSRRCVQAELEVKDGSREGAWANPKLVALAEQIQPEESAWVLVAPAGLRRKLEQLRGPLGLQFEFPEIDGFLLSARFDTHLIVRLSARAAEAEGARNLAELARGGIALLKMALAADRSLTPDLAHLLDSLALEVREQDLRFSLIIPRALLSAERHPRESPARHPRESPERTRPARQ